MSARDKILQRLKRNLASGGPRQTMPPDWPNPDTRATPAIAQLTGEARTRHFLARLDAMHGTYTQLSSLDNVPAAISCELRKRNIRPSLRMGNNPEFQTLEWDELETSIGPGRREEPATLSRAFCASAETGTVVLLSSSENPVSLSFLGETHFVVVKKSEIEAGFEGIWQRLRASGKDPRTVNLITGPSRTADIEQTLELGAHGPLALHVFLIDG